MSYGVQPTGAADPGTGHGTTEALQLGAGSRRLDAAVGCLVRVTVKAKPETECSSKGGSLNLRLNPDQGSVSFSCGASVNTLKPSLATAYYGQDCSETEIPLKGVAEGAALEMNDSSGVYTLVLPTAPLKPLELCYVCAESSDSDRDSESCKVRISVEGAVPRRAKESTGGASAGGANIIVLLAGASLASWAT
ncbi:hypothetical protein CSUI_003934 [Cystoisospora suis]|uniref:SRS domain-containing protein n=1 Tax=Cystoisospora suis TaxID=483139 RepID=A0A2C6L0J2_9APIC|nr:hypothetical protein CSUI_003934 [Cystoisospora suis]